MGFEVGYDYHIGAILDGIFFVSQEIKVNTTKCHNKYFHKIVEWYNNTIKRKEKQNMLYIIVLKESLNISLEN